MCALSRVYLLYTFQWSLSSLRNVPFSHENVTPKLARFVTGQKHAYCASVHDDSPGSRGSTGHSTTTVPFSPTLRVKSSPLSS